MRKLAVAAGMVMLASCSGQGEVIPTPSPAPEVPTTTEAINTTVLVAAEEPVTTTTETPTTTEPAPATIPRRSSTTTTEYLREEATTQAGTGNCGGDLPPCYVMMRESRGSLTVYNYSGSGASGKWQFMPSTWDGYGGYANAADAPESVQDAKARKLWAGGAGCAHWSAC